MTSEQVLQEYFGFDAFRDVQKEAITSLINNQNTLCLMPTGMGKSLIYQVAALQKGKMALVISPLLALMGQQSNGLNEVLKNHKKSSVAFNSNLNSTVKKDFKYLREEFNPPNNPHFLFVSPEKMMLDGYAEYVLRLNKSKIGLIVIDEAHCVSQWGHSFRPSYKMIPTFLQKIFGDNIPPILCLTATINQKDKIEIINDFNIQNVVISNSLLRTNIELNIEPQVQKNDKKREKLEEIFARFKNEKIIVYTHIKKRDYGSRAMSKYYKDKGYSCEPFDADLDPKEKDRILADFISGNTKIIFATSAFGMGIDIPDIRCVVHYLIPENIEQYYQEVGRAGRDGKPAYAYLLQTEANLRVRRDLIKKGAITKEKIETFWENLFGRKRIIPHIGQLGSNDVSDDNSEMLIFLKLVQKGLIQIISKGFQDVNCFQEVNLPTDLSLYQSKTRNGFIKLISKKMNIDIDLIHQNLFELLHTTKITLLNNPSKVLYYKIIKELDENELNDLVDDFEVLKNAKLNSLKSFYELLNLEQDISIQIKNYLNETTNS